MLQCRVVDSDTLANIVVDRGDTTFTGGAESELGIPRCTEFSDDEDVERSVQGTCNLGGHGNSTTCETENECVGVASQ